METARDLARTEVVSVTPETPVSEVEQIVSERRIGGVPVMDESGELMGIISASDLVRLHAKGKSDIGSLSAWEVMTPDVLWVAADTPLHEVASRMVEAHVHRILVYDGDKLIGLITSYDMMKVVAESGS